MRMAAMRIGFAKLDITPPLGTELGGYAGYRPCSGIHDMLHCRAVVLEQENTRYALVQLELMCVDEALSARIAEAICKLGITQERLLVCAIHSHAAPQGSVPGEGPLDQVNNSCIVHREAFTDYMLSVVSAAAAACKEAVRNLEAFQVRAARGVRPQVGSERHTGAQPGGDLTVLQCRTESGKSLILYNFPCHPTVLSGENLLVSADCAGGVEEMLDADMAVFLNGAAGDISTRFTRKESSFAECARMRDVTVEAVRALLADLPYRMPEPLTGIHTRITLAAKPVLPEETAQKQLEETTQRWQQAIADGADGATVRILKSYVEGAGVNLEFARTLRGITQLHLPVTVFRFCGLDFVTVPGELFSTLQPENLSVIAYTNGYYRYVCDENAYEAGYYEALAAIVARGEGEKLMAEIHRLLCRLKETQEEYHGTL